MNIPALLLLMISSYMPTAQEPPKGEVTLLAGKTKRWIGVSEDSTHFVYKDNGNKFLVWGLNYDRDDNLRLLEDYWESEWNTVVEDFREMKQLGANVIRLHLQFIKFMIAANKPNPAALRRLASLIKLAENTGVYLDLTGLGCYRKQDVPEWYDKLPEAARWEAQAVFWKEVAKTAKNSPAIFCYDLMNEPLIAGAGTKSKEWLAGELAGFYYCQNLSLDIGSRTQKEVAKQWIEKLTAAIKTQDKRHMITVGVIPVAFYFPGAKPLFYDKTVCEKLDFVSVHLYPKTGEVEKALKGLSFYEIGKPLIVEEIFPLECTTTDLDSFVTQSGKYTDGWIGFYWGATLQDTRRNKAASPYMIPWLEYFKRKSSELITAAP